MSWRRVAVLLAFVARLALAADTPLPYTDTTSSEALRNMARICSRAPKGLSEAERVEWVRARFAWIALLRLQGKDEEAADVFAGCGVYCGKWGDSKEWVALKKWGCRKRKSAEPCK